MAQHLMQRSLHVVEIRCCMPVTLVGLCSAPQMMSYLRLVADVRGLSAKVLEWQRKVEVASVPGAARRTAPQRASASA
jgi:hypothetical protein